MAENIEKLLEREDKLKIVANKAEGLNVETANMSNFSAAIRKRAEEKAMKMKMVMGGIVMIVAY